MISRVGVDEILHYQAGRSARSGGVLWIYALRARFVLHSLKYAPRASLQHLVGGLLRGVVQRYVRLMVKYLLQLPTGSVGLIVAWDGPSVGRDRIVPFPIEERDLLRCVLQSWGDRPLLFEFPNLLQVL